MANLTAHEKLELHEILRNEALSIKKIESNVKLVEDREFAAFIRSSLADRRQRLEEMQQFINKNSDIQ